MIVPGPRTETPEPHLPRARRAFAGALLAVALLPTGQVAAQSLYFSQVDGHLLTRADRTDPPPPLVDVWATVNPFWLEVDSAAGTLYWVVRNVPPSDPGPYNGIVRANLDGSGGVEVLLADVSPYGDPIQAPRGLALDVANRRMYWVESGATSPCPCVRSATLDGDDLETVVTGLQYPVALALDVGAGKVYWTEHTNDRVMRANLDGSGGVEVVADVGLDRPEGIALDVARGKVYWTETTGNRIQRADLAPGSAAETVVSGAQFADLVGIRVDVAPGTVYAVDYTTNRLWRTSVQLPSPPVDLLYEGLDGPWDLALDRAPCSVVVNLVQGQWKQLGLPCDPGGASTVAQVLADLGGSQNEDWALFEWDPALLRYHQLGPGESLEQGRGYWLKTLLDCQSVTLDGLDADTAQRFSVPLATSAGGAWTMVGHPFPFAVSWAGVRVFHDGQLMTLDQVDPLIGDERACAMTPPHPDCVMSRVAFTWNGAAYTSFNGFTPGATGALAAASGFWVRGFQPATLLVPALPESTGLDGEPDLAVPGAWWVRLTVESDGLADDGNLLGQLPDARLAADPHDLEEMPPHSDDFLTVVFPHPEWGDHAGNYTTDFHPVSPTPRADRWRFEVRSGVPGRTVILRWDGQPRALARTTLVDLGDPSPTSDLSPRAAVEVSLAGSYAFRLAGTRRVFEWTKRGGVTPTEHSDHNR